ncbi:MAG: DUF6356 family protein [Pseudomonadota bacterium]
MSIFTDHPHKFGFTYWQHLVFSQTLAVKCCIAFASLIIHSFLPFLFQTAGSTKIEECEKMLEDVHRTPIDS